MIKSNEIYIKMNELQKYTDEFDYFYSNLQIQIKIPTLLDISNGFYSNLLATVSYCKHPLKCLTV